MATSPHQQLMQLKKLARLLDAAFVLPGTKLKIGIDPIVGLIPVVGDLLPALCSLYIIYVSKKLGVPRKILSLMYFNVVVDTFIGMIPILGDTFDAYWKSNIWNVSLLERCLENQVGFRLSDTEVPPGEQTIDVVVEYPPTGKS